MGYFDDINFELTQDGSIGLYDKKIGDIFHSRTGALKESYEKFINPIISVLPQISDELSVLDICYGIGYNTKALFNRISNYSINIDALEANKFFVYLSPFINDEVDNTELKDFILNQIYNSIDEKIDLSKVLYDISAPEYDKFISGFTRSFIKPLKLKRYNYDSNINKSALLHNIYYKYISYRMKSYLKPANFSNSSVHFYIGDARKTIFKTNRKYDIVFLDAFSPQKDPTLWTIDFLSVIKSKMKQNSILVSYSKSAPFRSALLELGFHVGKTFIDNIDMGTVASFVPNFIQYKLQQDDIAIIQTRSGIPYRDINLNLNSSAIIINRSIEGGASDRVSRTSFMKTLK